ncbi:MAG TPA: hypothetical protein VFO94_10560 [Gammaproteobacteria bacterium]|nr:hypothetical protein [Gammaproteobacteria bacterium]
MTAALPPVAHAALAAFVGTWSSPLTAQDDPGWSAADFFCFTGCTPAGREAIAALLRDKANAARSAVQLFPQAADIDASHAARALAPSAAARAASGGPPPGGTRFACAADGFAAQVLSPLPLAIEQAAGRVVLRYEEFGVRRVIGLDGGHQHRAEAPLGASRARLDGGALVIETSGIPPGRLYAAFGGLPHGERLRAVERYTMSPDGRWLDLALELVDPDVLAAPLVVSKRWRRTVGATLRAHGCDPLSAGLAGVVFEYLDPAKVDARRH